MQCAKSDLAFPSTHLCTKIEKKKKYRKLNTVEECSFFQIMQMKNMLIPTGISFSLGKVKRGRRQIY